MNNFSLIFNKWFKGWNYAYNGRLWLLWKDSLHVNVVATTDQCITATISTSLGNFWFSGVYRFNTGVERRDLWTHFSGLQIPADASWILAGDFNVIADVVESEPLCFSSSHRTDIIEFNEVCRSLSLFDHWFFGSTFTWFNNHDEGFIFRKLDRVLINSNWLETFPKSTVEFLAPKVSDHCLGVINLCKDVFSPPKPFRFFNFWTKHAGFLKLVKSIWECSVDGSSMVILFEKLKRLKSILKDFNQNNFSNISLRVIENRKELAKIQEEVLKVTTNEKIDEMKLLSADLHILLIDE